MATFDDVIWEKYYSNFKGYVGNPPTNEEEYKALDCWKDPSAAPDWLSISNDMSVKAVQNRRFEKYPPIHEQLDMIWHAAASGSLDQNSDFYKAIKAIKDANPKPGN